MRSYAVIPPLLLDSRQRNISYLNNNGRCDDFVTEYKERQLLNVWSQAEKDIFKEKFLQHPKNFGVIAASLEKKSVRDCVQYYYLSKKTENYKRLLSKYRFLNYFLKSPWTSYIIYRAGHTSLSNCTVRSNQAVLTKSEF